MARTYACSIRSHYSDGPLLVNTFCVRSDHSTGLGTDASPSETAAAINTWITDKFRFAYPNSVTLDELDVRELYVTNPQVVVVALTGNGGITVGSQLPREMVRVLTLKTDVGTRSGRGRMFMPTPQTTASLATPEQYVTSGTWFTNLQDLQSTLLAGHDFTHGLGGADTSHLSLRVHSRAKTEDYDVTAIVIRTAAKWLRSRSTTP